MMKDGFKWAQEYVSEWLKDNDDDEEWVKIKIDDV